MRIVAVRMLTAVLLMLPFAAEASSSGISGYSGKPPTPLCDLCHTAGATKPTVTLAGPSKLAPGEHGAYSLKIEGGPAVTAGVDIAVSGTAARLSPGAGTLLVNSEVVQSAPTHFAGGVVVYDFGLTAPTTPGTIALYACGLSADGNTAQFGDGTQAATMAVEVSSDQGDAGEPDSGVVDDAGAGEDAGEPNDAGATDSGAPDPKGRDPVGWLDAQPTDGCGCTVASRSDAVALMVVFGLALGSRIGFAVRRRR